MGVREPTKVLRSWTTDTRRWAAYKPRSGDIIIATPAKCGTTWTIQIANLLVEQSPEPVPIWSLSPWLDVRDYPIEELLDNLESQTRRRVIKTHSPSDAIPLHDEVRYIHVTRGGLDAFMSWSNHVRNYTLAVFALMDRVGLSDETITRVHPRMPNNIREFFRTWMTEGPEARLADDMPAARYFDIERSFWADRHRPNVLLVHYNDLQTDLDAEMRRISAFLDIPVNETVWPLLVEAARFETMRENGATLMPRGGEIWTGGHETFFHKGANARWRDVLTEADIAAWQHRVGREVSPNLARWMENGRHVAGDPRELED
ncbi:MAG: sulfotransferase domain-containing protein [Alphaproteobacteria bacterium]|nr:sulfotransferase domain-containing protein [Alphaproteobacteria bacterium]MBV9904228.1 sulfotransferase domain-containing protein [Alphaproteobacteria bacterium]